MEIQAPPHPLRGKVLRGRHVVCVCAGDIAYMHVKSPLCVRVRACICVCLCVCLCVCVCVCATPPHSEKLGCSSECTCPAGENTLARQRQIFGPLGLWALLWPQALASRPGCGRALASGPGSGQALASGPGCGRWAWLWAQGR